MSALNVNKVIAKRHTTLAFRVFRNNLTDLSKNYWFHQLAVSALSDRLAKAEPKKMATDVVAPYFKNTIFPESVKETLGNSDSRQGAFRLHILVMVSALLEAYLEEAITLYIGGLGYAKGPYELNEVGKAMGDPVCRSSTIPKMMKYTEALLGVSLTTFTTKWVRAYKLRCVAAHNGGWVTQKVLRKIPDLGVPAGARIELTWPGLCEYMEAAEKAAVEIDKVVSTPTTRRLELEWHLIMLRDLKKLPPKTQLWQYVHAAGFQCGNRIERTKLEAMLY